jgi:hypothetical protein
MEFLKIKPSPNVKITWNSTSYTLKCNDVSLISKEDLFYLFPKEFNPLNAELNPICHLLVLLGDLTFMGLCIVSIFQYTCISNKMQRNTVYLYLETALHVSGSTSTHHQEHIQLYLQRLVFVTPLLLPSANVEELELV